MAIDSLICLFYCVSIYDSNAANYFTFNNETFIVNLSHSSEMSLYFNLLLLLLRERRFDSQMVLDNERYFQHFKGGLYKLLLIAKDSESLEPIVVYQAMYGEHEIWTRPASSFFSRVKHNNGPESQRFRELTKEEFLCLQQKTENI